MENLITSLASAETSLISMERLLGFANLEVRRTSLHIYGYVFITYVGTTLGR